MKALTVLKALLMGLTVTIDEKDYVWAEDHLCLDGYTSTDTTTGKSTPVALGVEVDVSVFVNLCEQIPEKEFAILCANVALNTTKRPHRKAEGEDSLETVAASCAAAVH